MKKILIIAAAAIALIFSIWGFFRMRSETVSQKTDILVSIPENPCAVLRINKAVELSQNLLYNNNYWRSTSSIEGLGGIHGILYVVRVNDIYAFPVKELVQFLVVQSHENERVHFFLDQGFYLAVIVAFVFAA